MKPLTKEERQAIINQCVEEDMNLADDDNSDVRYMFEHGFTGYANFTDAELRKKKEQMDQE